MRERGGSPAVVRVVGGAGPARAEIEEGLSRILRQRGARVGALPPGGRARAGCDLWFAGEGGPPAAGRVAVLDEGSAAAEPAAGPEPLLAAVCDGPVALGAPVFRFDEAEELADYLGQLLLGGRFVRPG